MSSAETQNQNDDINPEGKIVLGVYIHCEGCADQVVECLRGFQGVDAVEIDAKNHKVTVKGKNADPTKVSERLRKKSGKRVELISPNPNKQEEKKEEKPQAEVNEVVLKIYKHCEGCAKEIKHCILKMEGVQMVDTDAGKNRVSVRGMMDPNKLVEFVNNRGGRHAEIVKQTKTKTNDQNSNQNTDYLHNSHHQLVFAPQLFTDENPTSCKLM